MGKAKLGVLSGSATGKVADICWVRAFGGVGNAQRVSLAIGDTVANAPTSPSATASAFLTVAVVYGENPFPWRHALLGKRSGLQRPRRVDLREASVSLAVNDGRFHVALPELEGHPIADVWSETFELSPAWSETARYHTCITVVFYLRSDGVSVFRGDSQPVFQGWAASGHCDELGVVLIDVPAVRSAIADAELPAPDGLIAFLGSEALAERLVSESLVVPVWGMRPWLYRVASPGRERATAPLGRRVGGVLRYPMPASRCLTVVPGRALENWRRFEAETWPELRLPQDCVALELEVRTIHGYEPLSPHIEVGVLPTIVVRGSREPHRNGVSLIDGVDPFDLEGAQPPSARDWAL